MTSLRALLLACALLAMPLCLPAADSAVREDFEFSGWQGPALRVFISRPNDHAEAIPVVIVMHGVKRNADEYRDQWHELASQHGFLLAVPRFSQADFPGAEGYNLGNTLDPAGQPNPAELWSFAVLEPLFDELRKRYGLNTQKYSLYGHSAGGQYVHRFLLHNPAARVCRYVPANAGWYTLPDFGQAFPYGLDGSRVTREQLKAALQLPVTILLGDRDIDSGDPNLRHTPEADAQGLTRLARGFSFFESARLAAIEHDVSFNWHIATVLGVDHDNSRMAPAAIPHLLGPCLLE
jgi:dienelactone hydrolase